MLEKILRVFWEWFFGILAVFLIIGFLLDNLVV